MNNFSLNASRFSVLSFQHFTNVFFYGFPVFILLEIGWANALCRLIFFIIIGMFSGIIFLRLCFYIFLLTLPFCVCYCCCFSHLVVSGSSVPGIFQARILELVAISFSRGPPKDRTYGSFHISCITGRFFSHWITGSAPCVCIVLNYVPQLSIPLFIFLYYFFLSVLWISLLVYLKFSGFFISSSNLLLNTSHLSEFFISDILIFCFKIFICHFIKYDFYLLLIDSIMWDIFIIPLFFKHSFLRVGCILPRICPFLVNPPICRNNTIPNSFLLSFIFLL